MSTEVIRLREAFLANRTLKRSVSWMYPTVNGKLARTLTILAAFTTSVLTFMNRHVTSQRHLGRKAFLTDRTPITLFSHMHKLVIRQQTSTIKPFVARWAPMTSFTFVLSFTMLHISFLSKPFVTYRLRLRLMRNDSLIISIRIRIPQTSLCKCTTW